MAMMHMVILMKNKITITDDNIIFDGNGSIIFKDLSEENNLVNRLSLDVLSDSLLEIEYNIEENKKLNILINIQDNVNFTLIDKKIGNDYKVKYDYRLGKNSHVVVNKINDTHIIKENETFNLDGENSKLNYVLKTICNSKELYNIIVNHNAKKTTSKVVTNGINIDSGHLVFNVTGFVPKGCKEANVMQDNRIINLTNHKCQINPNLFIDEENVIANHAAHISTFDKNDLFYIQSRGINRNDAIKLLVKGFMNKELNSNYEEYIDSLVKKYWR